MIIRDGNGDTGLLDIQYEGDKIKYTHVQQLDNAQEELAMMEAASSPDGFSKDRTLRYIGTIPAIIWLQHPEFMHDTKALNKWLQSEEGRKWCVNLPDTGRSGKIIIK